LGAADHLDQITRIDVEVLGDGIRKLVHTHAWHATSMGGRGLAELHLHLYGTIPARALLEFIAKQPDDQIAWDWYEERMHEAYGDCPPTRDIVERFRSGDEAAADDFETAFVFGDADAGNFDRFSAKFNLLTAGSEIVGFFRGVEGADVRLTDEVGFFLDAIRDHQIDQGIGHAEQRLYVGDGIAADVAVRLLETIVQRYATADDAIEQRLAVSLARRDPWVLWEAATALALGEHGHVVTGIDFCHVEEGHPPKDKAAFFDAVRDFNDAHPDRALAILYHVGESFRDKSLESSVRWVQEAAEFGANRLGHAIALGVDPRCYGEHTRTETGGERLDQIAYDLAHADALERHGVTVDRDALRREQASLSAADVVTHTYDSARLDEVARRQDFAMDRVTAAGAVVEVCPTSNRRIGDISDPEHHPVHRFLERGVPVVIGSDDPGIFGTTLAEEIDWVVHAAGLDDDARHDLVANGWRYRSEVMTGRIS
jgi:adenosine deaminase